QGRLGACAVIVGEAGMFKRTGEQDVMAVWDRGTGDVADIDRACVLREAVETAAVDQSWCRVKAERVVAKIGYLEADRFSLPGGEAAAVIDGRGAVIDAENGEPLFREPAAHFAVTAANVDHTLTFLKPARLDRFDEFLLRLLGFPERVIFRIGPVAFPLFAMLLVRAVRQPLFDPALQTVQQLKQITHRLML